MQVLLYSYVLQFSQTALYMCSTEATRRTFVNTDFVLTLYAL